MHCYTGAIKGSRGKGAQLLHNLNELYTVFPRAPSIVMDLFYGNSEDSVFYIYRVYNSIIVEVHYLKKYLSYNFFRCCNIYTSFVVFIIEVVLNLCLQQIIRIVYYIKVTQGIML